MATSWLRGILAGAIVWALAHVGSGQEQADASAKQRAERLERMRAVAKSIEVFANDEQRAPRIELAGEPVLSYSDNTRKNNESSLWIWGPTGRPSAIMAIEFYPEPKPTPRWLCEIASLSTERISVRRQDALNWSADEPGLQLRTAPDSATPAEKPARRLSQMRELFRRFTAHEVETTEGRIELRPLSAPLYRYDDDADGLIDGAIFAFANGTNPEVLLVLEAIQPTEGPPKWVYGLAQMTGAAVSASLDGKEVWNRGEADPPATRPSYMNGWIPVEAERP